MGCVSSWGGCIGGVGACMGCKRMHGMHGWVGWRWHPEVVLDTVTSWT